ncbi:MAG TPA: TonB-dependent receptor [Prolixibacteraceae bacterium]|nr:TonB-dependent receptor [Prolixibacteraceae bacterium]
MKQVYPFSVGSSEAVNHVKNIPLKVTVIAKGIKFFVITLLTLSPFYLQAQQDSVLKVSSLKELSLEELMNITVITASGSEQTIAEAPSTMQVITSSQIAERGYEQLDDVLRDIPGVDLMHTYGRAPTFITFRGMYGDENKRILYMIDGIVENNIMGDYEMAGPAYSLHNVERIEIIWGPGSALYGANAFSAVINIITKKGAEINGFQYQKGYGSYNTTIENVMLGVEKGNIDLALSGSLFNTDGPRFENRDPKYSNSYISNAFSFNGNIIYTIKNFHTTLGVRAYQTPGGYGDINPSPTQLLGLPSQGNQNTGAGGIIQSDFNGEKPSLADVFSRTAFLQSEFTPSSKLKFFARGQYRETALSDKSYAYLNLPGTGYLNRLRQVHYANRVKGEISANYVFTEHHTLSAGLEYGQDNLERGFREVIPDTRFDTIQNIPVTNINATLKPRDFIIQNNMGAYLQYVLHTNIFKKTDLTLGGRYDHNSVYGTTINPRVGVISQPHEKITFKLLYGSAFRAPTNFELYSSLAGARISNPDLKPEKVQSYEANIIYTPVKILLVQANVFKNQLTDVIIQDVPLGDGNAQNQNIGTASVHGIESKLDVIPSKSFSAFLNFTYQEGTQNNGTVESAIPNIAKVKGNIGFSTHLAELLNISLIGNWVGNRSVPSTNPLGKVNGYFIPNLVISTNKLFDNRVSASLNIRNLFNQTYYDPGIRIADGKTLYPTVVDQPGINGLFKISVSLY